MKRHVELRIYANDAFIYSFLALAVLYAALVLLLPADPSVLEKYQITAAGAKLLNLTVVLPAEAIWLTSLYGYLRFRSYARLIKDSAEGNSFNRLADGLGILALSLPLRAVMSAVFNQLAIDHTNLETVATLARNYSGLLFALLSFSLIASGAKGLLTSLRSQRTERPLANYAILGLILLSSVFTWLILASPTGSTPETDAYHSPDWVIIFTLAIPYLFAWYQGALATYRLYTYKNRVRGHLYRQAFGNLAAGIGLILVLSILLQFITTLSERLNRLELTPILLIVYLLVLLYAVGFGLVARGAKKFKKIEEV